MIRFLPAAVIAISFCPILPPASRFTAGASEFFILSAGNGIRNYLVDLEAGGKHYRSSIAGRLSERGQTLPRSRQADGLQHAGGGVAALGAPGRGRAPGGQPGRDAEWKNPGQARRA